VASLDRPALLNRDLFEVSVAGLVPTTVLDHDQATEIARTPSKGDAPIGGGSDCGSLRNRQIDPLMPRPPPGFTEFRCDHSSVVRNWPPSWDRRVLHSTRAAGTAPEDAERQDDAGNRRQARTKMEPSSHGLECTASNTERPVSHSSPAP
jgi:hypothetical protein